MIHLVASRVSLARKIFKPVRFHAHKHLDVRQFSTNASPQNYVLLTNSRTGWKHKKSLQCQPWNQFHVPSASHDYYEFPNSHFHLERDLKVGPTERAMLFFLESTKLPNYQEALLQMLSGPKQMHSCYLNQCLAVLERLGLRSSMKGKRAEKHLEKRVLEIAQAIGEREPVDDFDLSSKEKESAISLLGGNFTSRNKTKVAKAVQLRLNQAMSIQSGSTFIATRTDVTLEHTHPRNPAKDWTDLSITQRRQFTNKLANMCLMPRTLNLAAGNRSYNDKKLFYLRCNYPLTSAIPRKYPNMTPESMKRRQHDVLAMCKDVFGLH